MSLIPSHLERYKLAVAADPMSKVAYAAEKLAFGPAPLVPFEQVPGFVDRARRGAGWPIVPLDIYTYEDLEVNGYVDREGIHLRHHHHYNPYLILHELAHWLAHELGHTARWARNYISLVIAGIGPVHGAALEDAFLDFKLPVAPVC